MLHSLVRLVLYHLAPPDLAPFVLPEGWEVFDNHSEQQLADFAVDSWNSWVRVSVECPHATEVQLVEHLNKQRTEGLAEIQ